MKSQAFSVLSFNFLGIPFLSKNYQKRLSALVGEIIKINPDILCFQEVWFGPTRSYLKKNLKPLGFRFFYHPVSKLRLNGLFLLSQKEILKAESYEFKSYFKGFNFSIFELFGVKSYCLAKIKLADKKEIFLFNVHLSVDWKNKSASFSNFTHCKLKEIEILSKAVTNLKDEKIILTGDFNFEPKSFLYKKFLADSGLKDTFFKEGHWLKTVLPNLYRFYVPKWGKRTDFLFTKNLAEDSILDFKILWSKPLKNLGYLSDHAGVLVKIKI